MTWDGKRVLVSGAGGFIGSHLVEALVRAGADVRALVRYNGRSDWGNLDRLPAEIRHEIDVRLGDVRDPFFVPQVAQGVLVVFHLAALVAVPYSQVAPHSCVATNVVGTLNMLEGALRGGVESFIHTSTSEVYGTARFLPIDESHPLQAQSPYAATKIGADKLVESYHRSFGLPIATVRPFNTFGPGQSARAIIPAIATQCLSRSHIEAGSLTPVRDFTYVSDVVTAFLRIAEIASGDAGVWNVGSGEGITVADLIVKIQSLLGKDLPVKQREARIRPATSEVEKLICDAGKITRCTGWKPTISLDEGLLTTLGWVHSHLHAYKSDMYNV